MEGFRDEMENVMGRFFTDPWAGLARFENLPWNPSVNVEETEKEIVVTADLPGVEPKDVEVSVLEGCLVIKGERKEEKEEKKRNFHRFERFSGTFYREVPLPPGADPDKITAITSKGVLKVSLPKKPEVLPKKVAVKVGE
jgi:HSP20 family protein